MTEWLETDGLGGFAMGTADGIRTRRYHALLLTATHPPDGRMVLVADLEVFVQTASGRFALSSHRYRDGVVYPDGVQHLVRFTRRPWPCWEWALPDGVRVTCELAIEHAGAAAGQRHPAGAPRVALRWNRIAGTVTSLEVQPLLAGRDYHGTHLENPEFRFVPELYGEAVAWQPYTGVPTIHCAANGLYHHAPDWYRAFCYSDEAERGLPCLEDLATPGAFTFDLASGPAAMVLSTGVIAGEPAAVAAGIFAAEARRRAGFASDAELAADAYIVASSQAAGHVTLAASADPTTADATAAVATPAVATPAAGTPAGPPGGKTIIAGYPWFADWGRDTFIALRGLCLATGRRDDARAILVRWAGAVSRGMLPNRFDERDASPSYNSVDAALWFVIAAEAYLAGGASAADRAVLGAAIAQIVDGYTAGTRHGIRADADGLLACGEPGVQLTWMDAIVDGACVTARTGKPVEIQALWINALIIAGRSDAAARARAAFARFWDPARHQLHDVIDAEHVPGAVDASCRPNQLLAIGGVPHPVIDGERARAVVDTVERMLWTPAGPRSLAPSDPRYRGRYVGGMAERDRSYHNGCVWPWLAGPFIEAWVRVRGDTAEARRAARGRFFAPLVAHAGLDSAGHLSEIYEGDPPHRPVGCPFQAWSVAELIRIDRLLG